ATTYGTLSSYPPRPPPPATLFPYTTLFRSPGHTAWSHPNDVDPASEAARQLTLLDALAERSLRAPDFAHGWWEAMREVRCAERRSEEHTSELQSRSDLVCRLLLEKKKKKSK